MNQKRSRPTSARPKPPSASRNLRQSLAVRELAAGESLQSQRRKAAASAIRERVVLRRIRSQTGIRGSRADLNSRAAEISRHTAAPKQNKEKLNSSVAIRFTMIGWVSAPNSLGAPTPAANPASPVRIQ